MGYNLYITRADAWCECNGREISLDEWLSLVTNDPELTLDPVNGESFALWDGPSRLIEPWLRFWDGNIHTTNPDMAVVAKMISVASLLGARVQGEEGEIYDVPPADW